MPASNNSAHFAHDDTANTLATTATSVNVLVNDKGGSAKHIYSLSQTGSTAGAATAQTADGATITLNLDGTIRYDPTTSPVLTALAAGDIAHDSFIYEMQVGKGAISTATVHMDVTGVYHPSDHALQTSLIFEQQGYLSDSGISVGTGAVQDLTNGSGAASVNSVAPSATVNNTGFMWQTLMEFDASKLPISSHPITSAVLDALSIQSFIHDDATASNINQPNQLDIYAFTGVGAVSYKEWNTGTVVGHLTIPANTAYDTSVSVSLDTSVLNQLLATDSHHLGFGIREATVPMYGQQANANFEIPSFGLHLFG